MCSAARGSWRPAPQQLPSAATKVTEYRQTLCEYDHAGRVVRQVANYQPKTAAGDDVNVATCFSYNPDGQTAEIRAANGRTGGQSTKFVYGVDQKSGSALAASHLLREIVYPDSFYANDADALRVKLAYNRQGEVVRRTDQNGTVHQYAFDCLGRPVRDTVTVVPPAPVPNETNLQSQIDATVTAIGIRYDLYGRPTHIQTVVCSASTIHVSASPAVLRKRPTPLRRPTPIPNHQRANPATAGRAAARAYILRSHS